MTIGFGFAEPIRDKTWILTASTKFSSAREKLRLASGAFLVAQDLQIHLPVVRTWSTKCGMFVCEIE
jgi:hypothetical protein